MPWTLNPKGAGNNPAGKAQDGGWPMPGTPPDKALKKTGSGAANPSGAAVIGTKVQGSVEWLRSDAGIDRSKK